MRIRFYMLATALFGAPIVPQLALAQTSITIPIILANAASVSDSVQMGLSTTATMGIDKEIGEEEYPPFPPTEVFHVRLINPPGHTVLGEGVKMDVRGFRDMNQKDTFRIKFQAGSGGYPVNVMWPADLAQSSGKLTIKAGGEVVNMLTANSYSITDDNISVLTIIREGSPVASVAEHHSATGFKLDIPSSVRRQQGLNVVLQTNASTSVTLRLCDAHGTLVSALPEFVMEGGQHSTHFSLRGLAAGAYFIVAETAVGTSVKRTIILQ
ncbi:MAG: hypothetical protein IT211_13245 [Armatimonadetes bacterium]|nr:hypothetical protein [Armatimonadota bacterium]